MNKQQFLTSLRRLLRELPTEERERILAYYREMIEDKVESGQTEQDAVLGLGNVYSLAQKILAENPNRRPKSAGKIILITAFSLIGVCIIAGISIGFAAWHSVWSQIPGSSSVSQLSGHYVNKTQTQKADGINSLIISAENKAVIIKPWDSAQIQVNYDTNAYQHYDFSMANGTFSIKNTESGGGWTNWTNGWNWNDQNTPTITIMLPTKYNGTILIDTTNSYINASSFSGLQKLRCETTNSAIKVDDLSAKDLEFQTENAAIELKNVTASEKIDADTQNAKIGLSNISAPDIALQTQNALITGTIHGREEDYSIEAQTTNAISNLENRSGGSKKLSVETTNAIIDVRFEN